MTTQLSTKFAALVVALMVNGVLIGGVGYLFSAQFHPQTAVKALAMTTSTRPAVPLV